MSYFDDQEEAWLEGGCQGEISDVDPFDVPDPPSRLPNVPHNFPFPQTQSQKSNARKKARKRRRALAGAAAPA